jgi:hypothetical protein
MSLNVTLNLPADIEEKLRREMPNLEADVTEIYALELFRRGKLSHFELSQVLGVDRLQTDAWLMSHNVFEGSLTMADLDADQQTLERLMQKAR